LDDDCLSNKVRVRLDEKEMQEEQKGVPAKVEDLVHKIVSPSHAFSQ
jgi:hypothetical protein